MKIYTRSGDAGDTGLFGGPRVPKDNIRVSAYGDLDEANCAVGMALAHCRDGELAAILRAIQAELLDVGAVLATPPQQQGTLDRRMATPVNPARIAELEAIMDRLEPEVPPLKTFVLPGGSVLAACLHLCRTTVRRAERSMVSLHRQQPLADDMLRYINRLSDLFFMMARVANARAGVVEPLWQPARPPQG